MPSRKKHRKPTREVYEELIAAYKHFNDTLFDAALPRCLITLQRKGRTFGYFSAEQFEHKKGAVADEIALNPVYFAQSSPEEVLSTLVHEMVHLWQHHFAKPGRGRYHNRQWAAKMEELGLHPSDTGEPGGKRTGDCVSHYIVHDGPFHKAAKALLASGFDLSWIENVRQAVGAPGGRGGKAEPTPTRQKYTCGRCGLNAWAKFNAKLICGDCNEPMVRAETT